MASSRLYYYFLKVAGIGFVLMGGYALILAIFLPGEIQSEEPLGVAERVFFGATFSGLGLLLGFTGWRAAHVKVHSAHLEVSRNGNRLEVPWTEIAGITKLPFTAPPIYWIKFYDLPGVAVMPWSWIVLTVGFWSWDFSKFRDVLEVRIAEAAREPNQT